MGGIRRKRTYNKEFKLEAVRLVVEEGHSASSVERKLGTGKGVVYKWVHEYNADPGHPFPGKGQLKPPERELRDLKRELERGKAGGIIGSQMVGCGLGKQPDSHSTHLQ